MAKKADKTTINHFQQEVKTTLVLPKYHWCCKYHELKTRQAFELYVKMITTPQLSLCTTMPPLGHLEPTLAFRPQTIAKLVPLDIETL